MLMSLQRFEAGERRAMGALEGEHSRQRECLPRPCILQLHWAEFLSLSFFLYWACVVPAPGELFWSVNGEGLFLKG